MCESIGHRPLWGRCPEREGRKVGKKDDDNDNDNDNHLDNKRVLNVFKIKYLSLKIQYLSVLSRIVSAADVNFDLLISFEMSSNVSTALSGCSSRTYTQYQVEEAMV